MLKKLFDLIVKGVKILINYLVLKRFNQIYRINIYGTCRANCRNTPNIVDKISASIVASCYVYLDWLLIFSFVVNPMNGLKVLLDEWQFAIPMLIMIKLDGKFIKF